ncbi:MAG: hypothetical protein IKP66_03435, partial [Lachnospiraceae bacterium]|nr:hypothetical protein [Lachnospiraceae bacterium]
AERESIQSSIQKRIQQESIKAKIAQAETQKQYETPVYIEETLRRNQVMQTQVETVSPTSVERLAAVFDNNVKPTPAYVEEYEIVVEEAQTVTLSECEPGDFISETVAKNVVTNKVSQVQVDSPTSERVETMAETMPETTLKVFDAPIIEEETSAAESEVASQESAEETEEKKEISDEEDGKGSKGGEDAEKEEDMTGDDGENESLGNADNHGKYHLETEGDYAGKKIFELERNGNIGLDPEHLSVTNMKGMMTAVMTLLFLLGALTFVLGTRDKIKKNNYF